MNQGRIWCVVHPTVGLPLMLTGVATISLLIHASVMTHTNWMGNYWQGGSKTKAADMGPSTAVGALMPKSEPGFVISVAPVAATAGNPETSFVITLAPKAAASPALATGEVGVPASKTLAMAAPAKLAAQ